jgi:hypothetical protein
MTGRSGYVKTIHREDEESKTNNEHSNKNKKVEKGKPGKEEKRQNKPYKNT